MRVLSVLGSTGSIGTQTLEVCRKDPDNFKVASLTCGSSVDKIYEQILEFKPLLAACADEKAAATLNISSKPVPLVVPTHGPKAHPCIAEI